MSAPLLPALHPRPRERWRAMMEGRSDPAQDPRQEGRSPRGSYMHGKCNVAWPSARPGRLSQPQLTQIARQTWATIARQRRAIAIFWPLLVRL
jgi:hypothetical protein